MRVGVFARALVLLLTAWAAFSPAAAQTLAPDGAVVLMYHRFGEDELPATNIRLEQFDAHLASLRTGGFNVVPLQEIVDAFRTGTALPDRTVAITIDDAYRSIYEVAWPKLKAAGFPFTVFVATGPVDAGHPGYMTWDQLRELQAAGVTIGNHTVDHAHLPELGLDQVRAEILGAQDRLRAELGVAPSLFAYPYGEASREIETLAAELGFEAAFGQHSGVAYAAHDRYYLPRFALNEAYGEIERFRLVSQALPLPAVDVSPGDPTLRTNPPAFGFTLNDMPGDAGGLACYASHVSEPLALERLGENRIEVRLPAAFPPGRGRINCTMPAAGDRWRWFGMQYYVPAPGGTTSTAAEGPSSRRP